MKLLVAASLLILAVSSAAAQQKLEYDTGSHIPVPARARIPEGAKTPTDSARITTAQFARCVVARNPKGVARTLDLLGGKEYSNGMSQLATNECLDSGGMRIPQNVMRGALFVELYHLYAAKQQVLMSPRPLDFTNPLLPEYRSDPARYSLLAFADCVAKLDPANARTIVMAPATTDLQNAAFKALMPSLSGCLVGGQKISFSKPILEGVLAEVLYREALAPAAVAGTK